jgi:non-specific serine/threonine protein kinase
MHSHLPLQLSTLVGRAESVAELRGLLFQTRLLTLTGTGGIGKTRLALAVAEAAEADFAGGTRLAELGPLDEPARVPQCVAASCGVREGGPRLLEQLVALIGSRRLLLLLDNCEHVVQACAELSEWLLGACPELRILATSREPLGIAGEVTWRVPGLEAPEPAAFSGRAAVDSAAVQLFVDRARAVDPRFALTEHNSGAVAEVCWRLDGIPLALELAAARVKILTPAQIAARLSDRFRLLVGGRRTAPRRQQTLQAALEWSYDLLSDPERLVFERLSVFVGGCSLEAAEAVCAGPGLQRVQVLELLGRLVDRSLVLTDADDSTRYRCLETVRQYGRERLIQRRELALTRDRHAKFFVRLAEQAERDFVGPRQFEAVKLLAREQDNLHVGLAWFMSSGAVDEAQRMAGAMYRLWQFYGSPAEGRVWLERLLAVAHTSNAAGRIKLLHGAALLACHMDDFDQAQAAAEAGLRLSERIGDHLSSSYAMHVLGVVALARGEYARARQRHAEGIRLSRLSARSSVYPAAYGAYFEVLNLQFLGQLESLQGDDAAARAHLEAALARARRAGMRRSSASALRFLGLASYRRGDLASARDYLRQMVESFEGSGEDGHRLWGLTVLGCVARDAGDTDAAYAFLREVLDSGQGRMAAAGPRTVGEALEAFSGLAAAVGQHERAVRLAAASSAVLERIAFRPMAELPAQRWHWLDGARAALGTERADAAAASGRAMTLSQAIAEALAVQAPVTAVVESESPQMPLTRRELEVANLVARGCSNREIAEELVIATTTAERHVANILAKLGLSSRTQIAMWVVHNDVQAQARAD